MRGLIVAIILAVPAAAGAVCFPSWTNTVVFCEGSLYDFGCAGERIECYVHLDNASPCHVYIANATFEAFDDTHSEGPTSFASGVLIYPDGDAQGRDVVDLEYDFPLWSHGTWDDVRWDALACLSPNCAWYQWNEADGGYGPVQIPADEACPEVCD